MEKIVEVLENEPHVLFAYFFGSRARGKQRGGSDIDIAVYVDEEQEPLFTASLALKMEKALGTGEGVDVRILNGSALRFRHQVLKYGRVIHSRDEKARISFEAISMCRYMDFKPYLDAYNRARMERLKA